jgi:hypothetical protein
MAEAEWAATTLGIDGASLYKARWMPNPAMDPTLAQPGAPSAPDGQTSSRVSRPAPGSRMFNREKLV